LILLDWDELSEEARKYIIAKASRKVYETHVGAQENRQNLYQEEITARASLLDMDTQAAQYNMLDDPTMPTLRGSQYVPGAQRNTNS
ncbi:MAG TPA: hypothetical protein V6D20_21570, partial [Candidatus Obscuribacterales bacterium]